VPEINAALDARAKAGTREQPVVEPKTSEDLDAARKAVDANATPAQREALNFRQGHAILHGIDITLQVPKGTERQGPLDENGKPAWTNINPLADYGQAKRTESGDGEPLDVLIGHNLQSKKAFVFDQHEPKTGAFDEHKSVLAVDTPEEAMAAYDAQFSDGSGPSRRMNGGLEMTIENFKDWLKHGDTTKAILPQAVEHGQEERNVARETEVARDTLQPVPEAEGQGEGTPVPEVPRGEHEGVAGETAEGAEAKKHAGAAGEAPATPESEAALETRKVADETAEIVDLWKTKGKETANARFKQLAPGNTPYGQNLRDSVIKAMRGEKAPPKVAPGTPVSERPVDSHKHPIFEKGERVVINDEGYYQGRHGEISERNAMTMRPIFGGGASETSYHYTIKTDQGSETYARDMEPETGERPESVPDPEYEGQSLPPKHIQARITNEKNSAAKASAASTRARVPAKKMSWLREASRHTATADALQKVLQAWVVAHPAEAERALLSPKAPAAPAAKAETPAPSAGGVTVTQNEAKNGVEIKFATKPSVETIARIKSAGFKWSGNQGLWYAKRNPRTLDLAKSLVAEKPKTMLENNRNAFELALRNTSDAQYGAVKYRLRNASPTEGWTYSTARSGERPQVHAGTFPNAWSRDEAIAGAVDNAFPNLAAKKPSTALAPKLSINIDGRAFVVDSLEDASRKFRATVEEMGVGASDTPEAVVRDSVGNLIGHVAYNGRIFEGRIRDQTPQTKVLYDPGIAPESPAPAPQTRGQWTTIGTNERGQTLWQDERGVRSYVENGIRHTEPVWLHPKRGGGMEISVDRKANPEFEVAQEPPKLEQPEPQPEPEPEPQPEPKEKPSEKEFGAGDARKARYEELKAKMRDKLKNQASAGLDPEILQMGIEMAVYNIENGVKKFAQFARKLAEDLGVALKDIRPYLRSWYNGARDQMEDMGGDVRGMDDAEAVKAGLAEIDAQIKSDAEASNAPTRSEPGKGAKGVGPTPEDVAKGKPGGEGPPGALEGGAPEDGGKVQGGAPGAGPRSGQPGGGGGKAYRLAGLPIPDAREQAAKEHLLYSPEEEDLDQPNLNR
jgi:hypothetical protein